MIFATLLVLMSLGVFIYSYLWVSHPFVTFITVSHPEFNFLYNFRFLSIDQPRMLANIHILISLLLLGGSFLFAYTKLNKISLKKLLVIFSITTLTFSLSYPYLSKDIFYYLFSARMVEHYNLDLTQNTPKNLVEKDMMTVLVDALGQPYPYGKTFLYYSLIPAYLLSSNRFLLFFFSLKLMAGLLFFVTGYLIYKITKDKTILPVWFLNPYLVIELLINSHNDLLMIFLFITSFYFAHLGGVRFKIFAVIAFIGSITTKFSSIFGLPLLALQGKAQLVFLYLVSTLMVILLQNADRNVQPWYFTWPYMFLPFMRLKWYSWLIVSFLGILLLVNYYYFLATGHWGQGELIKNGRLWVYLIWGAFLISSLPNLLNISRLDLSKQTLDT